MMRKSTVFFLFLILMLGSQAAQAIQVDWSGQFWAENQWLNNYQLDRARPGYDNDANFNNTGSPYVPGVGEKNIVWFSSFFKLKPKVIVNDSVNIRSEWHLGSQNYGFWGRSFPTTGDERFNFTGAQKDGMLISAQRIWLNLLTDFGTIEVGRAPLHWGLGALWNAGDNLFDRYQNTVDTVRLTSKFGNFSIQPALVKVVAGNNAGGAGSGTSVLRGSDDITDYDLAVKYDNTEDDFDLGMMWTKRTGSSSQKTMYFNRLLDGSTRINLNMFDFYARKKIGRFWFGGELPLFNGSIGAIDGVNEFDYKTLALVFEGGYTSDIWDIGLKAGHVPGQPSGSTGDTKYKAIYLNKDYKLGLILFNYNLWGLSNNNPDSVASASVSSPYDNQIVNANYLSISPEAKLDKWTLKSNFVFAWADKTAIENKRFYNHQSRAFYNAINESQGSFLGWEMDYGVAFKWDENFVAQWDMGLLFPGNYFEYSNTVLQRKLNTHMMFASQLRMGVTF